MSGYPLQNTGRYPSSPLPEPRDNPRRQGTALRLDYARKQAERRAFDFSGVWSEKLRREYARTNYDEDGDEMFHDLLDVLYVVSQPEQIGWGGPPRDGFRPLAKDMRGDDRELLHHLTIPQDVFRVLMRLLLVTHFGRPDVWQFEQSADLDCVSESIVKAFAQGSKLGITWEVFDQALGKMVCLHPPLNPSFSDEKLNKTAGIIRRHPPPPIASLQTIQ